MVGIIHRLLASITLIVLIVLVGFLISSLLPQIRKKMSLLIEKKANFLILLISLTATLGSLFYSEVALFTPCKLCWFQRIFMYSQPVINIISRLINDKKVYYYHLVLSFLGLLIAVFHYFVQWGIIDFQECATVGYSVSCTEKFTGEYSFITIPLMSATAFLAIVVVAFVKIKYKGQK